MLEYQNDDAIKKIAKTVGINNFNDHGYIFRQIYGYPHIEEMFGPWSDRYLKELKYNFIEKINEDVPRFFVADIDTEKAPSLRIIA